MDQRWFDFVLDRANEQAAILSRLFQGERKARLICIDGRDAAGKSSFSKLLAARLDCGLIGMDLFIRKGDSIQFDEYLGLVLKRQVELKNTVLVEGILSQQTLSSFGFTPFHRLRIIKIGHSGSPDWQGLHDQYEIKYSADNTLCFPCREVFSSSWECNLMNKTGTRRCTFCPEKGHQVSPHFRPWW